LGTLALALVLVGCRRPAGDPIEPAETETAPPTAIAGETTAGSPAVESGYQQGFTNHGEPFRGNPAAAVVIEEFSSYQCPFCGKYFRESYPQVMADYVETGQVLYIFRDFPLASQPQSRLAAESANCAGSVGGGDTYWTMHDLLFERQAEWSGRREADAIFKEYAIELGLNTDLFGECLDSGATRADVEADAAEGTQRGVRGTPTFFINGQPLVGAQPYEIFRRVIELAGKETR
jgi:protein-disulfide isomerase